MEKSQEKISKYAELYYVLLSIEQNAAKAMKGIGLPYACMMCQVVVY